MSEIALTVSPSGIYDLKEIVVDLIVSHFEVGTSGVKKGAESSPLSIGWLECRPVSDYVVGGNKIKVIRYEFQTDPQDYWPSAGSGPDGNLTVSISADLLAPVASAFVSGKKFQYVARYDSTLSNPGPSYFGGSFLRIIR